MSSGLSQPDINSMKQITMMMRYSHLDNRCLRSFLTHHVHYFTTISDQWLRNFRRKVLKYLIDPSLDITANDLPKLNCLTGGAAEEDIVLDSELKKQKF